MQAFASIGPLQFYANTRAGQRSGRYPCIRDAHHPITKWALGRRVLCWRYNVLAHEARKLAQLQSGRDPAR